MKRLFQTFFACIILLLATVQVKSQYLGGYEPSPGEQAYLDSLPGPYISFYSKNLQLPPVVDNSLKPYFRSIFSQDGGSCVQASTIGYVFTYMVNRERNISSNSNETTYPTHYTWNYCNNATNNGSGISTGWNVIKKSGIPNIASYGGLYRTFADDDANFTKRRTVWMSGYSDYRLALNNRVIESVFSIELMTSDDLDDIKHYLHDLGIGDLVKGGGLLSFGENFQNPVINDLVYPSAEAGKKVVTQWPTSGFGHAMTIVGYNDNVMWDFNGDGLYTNDGIISNWEIGAFKVANSWGAGWANDGFVYIPYRLFYSIYLSGIVIAENTVYNPKVTLRIEMDYSQRTYVNPRTGVSTDSASTTPQFIEQYETYWMPSGHIPMQGINEYPIEIELDITRKLSNIIPAKFFLDLHLVQNPGAGEVLNVSVVDYDTKDGIPVVVNCLPSFVPHTITQGFNRIPVDYDYLPSVIKQEIVVNRDLYIQKDISIADGGTLVINNSNIQLLENKSIVVNPGGTLEILNGGSVTVSGNGSIQIESHTTNPAVLVYYNGATIDLVDNNTCLDISGNLSIAANAQFTFTGAGYIKFSNPGDMYTENITCGTGASMLFQGSGKSDKVVEVQQDAVRFPALESLTFEDCKIVMSAGDQMLATADYPITFDNVLMTSATGINGKHRGFCFYGQENTVVNNCIFEYSSYGITGDLSVYGSPLEVSNSEFRYNTNGIHIYGRGIHASFCNFNHCNSNGAYCYGMSLPSEFLNCEFHHNGHNGFTFYGSSAADLDVEACDIYSNIYDGIITSGAFDLRLSCNNIYANRYGVYTQNGTYVYAENNAENDIHSNVRSIYLNYGRLFLNEGYNQLQAATDAYAVYGFSVEPGNCSASPQNIANNNRWEADDTEGPDYGTNYKLWKFQCSNPLVLVQLVDSIPDYTVCYHIDPDSLQEGGSCFQSNEETANLLNSLPLISLSGGISLPLDQAVTYLANQSDGVSSANAFNNLIDEYANLIFQCDNNTSDAVFLLKNKAYGDVHNTLTNYYEFIDYNSGHNGFNQAVDRMVLLHEDLLINPDIPDYLSIEYKLDIAMLNYLRKDYNRSITQLEFLINEIPDTVNAKAFVENWLCFVSAEKALREGTILPEEYEQSIAECNINYPVTIFDSPDHDEVQNANSTSEETAQVSIAINPNPNQGSFTVLVTNSSISGKIMITKATGQPVYETILTFAEQLVAVNGLPAGTFTVYYIENGTVITSVGTIVE